MTIEERMLELKTERAELLDLYMKSLAVSWARHKHFDELSTAYLFAFPYKWMGFMFDAMLKEMRDA